MSGHGQVLCVRYSGSWHTQIGGAYVLKFFEKFLESLRRPDGRDKAKLSAGAQKQVGFSNLAVIFSAAGIVLLLALGFGGAINNWMPASTPPVAKPSVVVSKPPAKVVVKAAPVIVPRRDLTGKIATLSKQIESFDQQIEQLKTLLDGLHTSDNSMARRLVKLENTLGNFTSSIDREVVNLPANKDGKVDPNRPIPPLAALPPDLRNLDPSTGSTGADRGLPEFSQTKFALLLGNSAVMEVLVSREAELKVKYGGLLGDLEMHIERPAKGRNVRRLLAGPIANAAQAARICVKLKAEGQFCRQVVFPRALLADAKAR